MKVEVFVDTVEDPGVEMILLEGAGRVLCTALIISHAHNVHHTHAVPNTHAYLTPTRYLTLIRYLTYVGILHVR